MIDVSRYEIAGLPVPLIEKRADPWLYRHEDGFYYFVATVPEYDRIELRRSQSLAELPGVRAKTIWTRHPHGEMAAHIWAPELHRIEGRWYIYFAAGRAENAWDISMYVLENSSANPLEGSWIERGRIETLLESEKTGLDRFYLDGTTCKLRGKHYFIWAQRNRNIPGNSNIYIAQLENPWTIQGEPVLLTKPEYSWEKRLFLVNEGPAVLIKHGKIFLGYSASGTDSNYCMGLLTASEASDPLDPSSWSKSPEPVFTSSEETGIYGPGHSCFSVAEDGHTDILVYHARSYKDIDGDPLNDPNRHTRIQKILWRDDGMPDFGIPVPDTRKV